MGPIHLLENEKRVPTAANGWRNPLPSDSLIRDVQSSSDFRVIRETIAFPYRYVLRPVQWLIPLICVPGHSGGTVTDLHRVPLLNSVYSNYHKNLY